MFDTSYSFLGTYMNPIPILEPLCHYRTILPFYNHYTTTEPFIKTKTIYKVTHGGFLRWGYPQIIHLVGFSLLTQPFWSTPIYGTPQKFLTGDPAPPALPWDASSVRSTARDDSPGPAASKQDAAHEPECPHV